MLGVKRGCVRLLEHQISWESEAVRAIGRLKAVLGDVSVEIRHVGSTAVRGIKAKPIIDIDVVIEDQGCFEKVKLALETIGYHHEGDLGIPGREAFKYEGKDHLRKHHLYVCSKDAGELKRHISLIYDGNRLHGDAYYKYG